MAATDDRLFAFGRGEYGRLGLGDDRSRLAPTQVRMVVWCMSHSSAFILPSPLPLHRGTDTCPWRPVQLTVCCVVGLRVAGAGRLRVGPHTHFMRRYTYYGFV